MHVLFTVGFRKAHGSSRDGQLIRSYVNGDEVKRSGGEFMHDKTMQGNMAWYYVQLDVPPQSEITVSVKTGLVGRGRDESRTFDMTFIADPDASLVEVRSPLLGYKNRPIIKGRMKQISYVSEAEKRQQKLDMFEVSDKDWKE